MKSYFSLIILQIFNLHLEGFDCLPLLRRRRSGIYLTILHENILSLNRNFINF
jgi:hypothetical protein